MLDSGSKVNVMTLAYAAELGIKVQRTNIGTHKIDRCLFEIYIIVTAAFQILDKFGRSYFFQNTFLLAKINIKVVFGMFFLILSNADI